MEAKHAVMLFGGGLDSLLTRALLARAGLPLHVVQFDTGFGSAERSARAGVVDRVVDVRRDYLRSVVIEAKHGYGAALNPCLDCRIFMLRRAAALARERGGGLLVTGEVIGQRSIDQSRNALRTAEREAGVAGRVFRPLSAALLPLPDGLDGGLPGLRLHGAGRRRQIALARGLGVPDWPTPSGRCCRLADPAFARRLRDLLAHRDGPPCRADVELLQRGRHFRLAWNLKLIVARDAGECDWLGRYAGCGRSCVAADGRGARALLVGEPTTAQLGRVASFVARYAGGGRSGEVEVELTSEGRSERLRALPATERQLAQARI